MREFHVASDSDGQLPYPLTFWIGRLSEEFGGRFPSEVMEEWRRWPPGFLEEVIEMRDYATAKRRMEDAKVAGADALQRAMASSPLVALAYQIDGEIVEETLRAQQHG